LRNDIATNGCIAGGVECCDLTAHTVQRRPQTAGQLFLEKLYFVKHFDDHSLTDFPKEGQILGEYRQLLHSILYNGLRKWRQSGLLTEIVNGQQFSRALEMLQSQNEGTFPKEVNEKQRNKFHEDSK
jgi:hypothetical protein